MGLLTCCDVVKCVRRTNDTTVRLCPLECRTKMPSRFTSLRVSIILYYDDVCWRVGSIRRKRRTTSRSFYSTQRTSNERNMTLFAVIAKTNHTKLPPQQQTITILHSSQGKVVLRQRSHSVSILQKQQPLSCLATAHYYLFIRRRLYLRIQSPWLPPR